MEIRFPNRQLNQHSIRQFILRKIFFKINFDKKINRFIFYGLLNLFLTNLVIQILLFFIDSIFATLIGQIINFYLGFNLYCYRVFKIKNFKINYLIKYIFLHFFLWNLNWFLIEFFYNYNFSKNIVSLLLIPFLGFISYFSQKNIVFVKE